MMNVEETKRVDQGEMATETNETTDSSNDSDVGAVRKIPIELIKEAITLKLEVPTRSVPQIIEILEMEGKVIPGFLKRSTLQDRLREEGYSTAQMKMYQTPGVAARRFARSERNALWQSDIKFGPVLKVGGESIQIYFVGFIDDATRYIVHGEFYDTLDQGIIEDCMRKAIIKEGVPQRVFFDNGTQFRTKWMERACGIMGIQLIFAKIYSPESKGKIERFNQTLNSFIAESVLKKPKSCPSITTCLTSGSQSATTIKNTLVLTPRRK